MKLHKSSIKRSEKISELPKGKVTITMNGEDPEGIWIAKDTENNVMYLLNHALMFYPMPSWGMELPLKSRIDLHPYRGDDFDSTEFTVCEETYDHLSKYIDPETDEFDYRTYLEDSEQKED